MPPSVKMHKTCRVSTSGELAEIRLGFEEWKLAQS